MSDVLTRLTAALSDRYRVTRELGAGGMATVYLAHDLKHDRDVAIKVLHPDLGAALGAERFLAEIKTTARLQHPHILPLLDSGAADGLLYYVMPYIAGETLRARLERARPLPVPEALRIVREVAGALESAHRQGVVHRDIKPENILLHEGSALVADFGIALAVQSASGARMTQTGLSLGTPQYMSPEQAMGERGLDARSDIYALGAVTYEMLAGDPPFTGSTVQAIVARVLSERPTALRLLRDTVPPGVEEAVATALAKLPADRFDSAKAFADALATPSAAAATPALPVAMSAGASRRATVATRAWAALALALAATLAVVAWRGRASVADNAPPVRFVVKPPSGGLLLDGLFGASISADGRRIAFRARQGNSRRVFVQELGSLEAIGLAGTEEARYFALAPDGRSLVFQSGVGGLRRVAVDGGAVTEVPLPRAVERLLPSGVTWSSQAIVVSLGVSGVVVIPTDGSPARVASITRAGTVCRCAQRAVLSPDGRHLFMAGPNLYVVPVEGGELRDLGVPGDAVVAVREDLVIYVSAEGALMAARLDAKRMTLSTPVSLRERVTPGSLPALSASGTLLMFTGLATTRLELVDDRGQGTPVADPGNGTLGAMFPRFSPDGRRIALSVMDRRVDALTSIPNTITVVDVAAGTATRLTNDLLADRPEWTPDGKRLIYRRIDSGREELWWQPFDRSQPAERLQPMRGIDRIAEGVLSPDSRWLLFRTLSLSTGRDIWYRALAGDTTPRPFEVTPYDEAMPRFSPDGRWVAYTSNEAGSTEVFVRPFPGPGGRTQISADGGTDPVWAPDGRRLFYLNGTELTAATLGTEQDLRVLSRDKLFAADVTAGGIHANFDVARDGRHFLMLRSSGSGVDLAVTLNWLATAVQGVAR